MRLSIRGRLLVLVALSVLLAALLTGFVAAVLGSRAVDDEDRALASATALGVALDIQGENDFPDLAEMQTLRETYQQFAPSLRSLSLYVSQAGNLDLTLRAGAQGSPSDRSLAERAVRTRQVVTDPALSSDDTRSVAAPIRLRDGAQGAVVVRMSLASLQRVSARIRTISLALVFVTAILTALVFDVATRRLVFDPLAQIIRGGGVASPTPGRADEIAEVRELTEYLRAEVSRATEQIRKRNIDLEETASRLFEARGLIARQQSLAAAGQMAASIAHRIGTPLSLISGHVQVALARLPPQSAERDRLVTVKDQIDRVTAVVRELLDVTRTPALDRRPVAVHDLLRSIETLSRAATAARGVDFVVDAPANVADRLLDIDASQIEQACLGLVTNSLDALSGPGRVSVEASIDPSRPDFALISVSDTGPGIPADLRPRVFDPLVTTKPRGRGSGLGLAIVRDIVQAHGGDVSARESKSGGACIELTLPFAKSQSAS